MPPLESKWKNHLSAQQDVVCPSQRRDRSPPQWIANVTEPPVSFPANSALNSRESLKIAEL